MGRSRYKILDERYPYFITTTVINRYPVFEQVEFAQIITDGLNFLVDERDIDIYAYVIMPDHIHIIAKGKNLGKHVSSFKSYSARRIIDSLERNKMRYFLNAFKEAKRKFKKDQTHQFWAEGYHPKQIFNTDVMKQKIGYIHYNPVKAGLAAHPKTWKNSSFGNYNGKTSGSVKINLFNR
ncbi:REP-associated tyrosine transposase [Gracilimonas halophila]|uniref:Transposase n=1 Tax=Gracilimonas halophila TaxID=1834464 RepID=A0ABW5JME2_9BACT